MCSQAQEAHAKELRKQETRNASIAKTAATHAKESSQYPNADSTEDDGSGVGLNSSPATPMTGNGDDGARGAASISDDPPGLPPPNRMAGIPELSVSVPGGEKDEGAVQSDGGKKGEDGGAAKSPARKKKAGGGGAGGCCAAKPAKSPGRKP